MDWCWFNSLVLSSTANTNSADSLNHGGVAYTGPAMRKGIPFSIVERKIPCTFLGFQQHPFSNRSFPLKMPWTIFPPLQSVPLS